MLHCVAAALASLGDSGVGRGFAATSAFFVGWRTPKIRHGRALGPCLGAALRAAPRRIPRPAPSRFARHIGARYARAFLSAPPRPHGIQSRSAGDYAPALPSVGVRGSRGVLRASIPPIVAGRCSVVRRCRGPIDLIRLLSILPSGALLLLLLPKCALLGHPYGWHSSAARRRCGVPRGPPPRGLPGGGGPRPAIRPPPPAMPGRAVAAYGRAFFVGWRAVWCRRVGALTGPCVRSVRCVRYAPAPACPSPRSRVEKRQSKNIYFFGTFLPSATAFQKNKYFLIAESER